MHPLNGTWHANIEKSRRHANHQFQRATMHFEIDGNAVVLRYEGINMSGKEEKSAQHLVADGVEYPIPQAPDIVAMCQWIGTHALETVGKRKGAVIGRGTYEVSVDGRIMTATVNGTDAGGKEFEQVIVFDRGTAVPK